MKIIFFVFAELWALNCPPGQNGARLAEYTPESKCVYIYETQQIKWMEAEKECQS